MPVETPATIAPVRSSGGGLSASGSTGRVGGRTPIGGKSLLCVDCVSLLIARLGPRAGSANSETVRALEAQIREMSGHLEGLEKERDFYFAKVSIIPRRPRVDNVDS